MTQTLAAQSISRLDVPALADLSASARTLIDTHHQENWIQALSINPETARRFAAYFESLFASTGRRLPLKERELIAVIVSATNGCGLCEVHHTRALGDILDDPERAQRIALDDHLVDLSEREQALVDLARKITLAPRSVGRKDFDRLRAAGLADDDILEAVETSAWFNHTNRIFISLGVIPDEKYFAR